MKKVSKETIIRTIVLIVTLINSVLTALDLNPLPFSESQVYNTLSTAATVAASVWAWWKNNSFTNAAITADSVMKALKEGSDAVNAIKNITEESTEEKSENDTETKVEENVIEEEAANKDE